MPSAIVVGAGVFGGSLALRLVSSGWEVTLVEQYPPGHVRAASGGESRLIRSAHGANAWYTRSARRALELWRELERESGTELFVPSGVAWFFSKPNGWGAESERVLREEGVPVERLAPEEGARLFPELRRHRPHLDPLRARGRGSTRPRCDQGDSRAGRRERHAVRLRNRRARRRHGLGRRRAARGRSASSGPAAPGSPGSSPGSSTSA